MFGVVIASSHCGIAIAGAQGRHYGVPMTMSQLMELTKGNVTFVDGGVYAADYESPGYLSPVGGHVGTPVSCSDGKHAWCV